jgi:hypothetical protein
MRGDGVNMTEYSRAQRNATQDRSIRPRSPEKTERINLGLEVLSVIAEPGATFTHQDIAAFCDCTRDAIFLIERSALSKIGNRLRFGPRD